VPIINGKLMKGLYSRIRIMLLALGLGLAAVYMQQGVSLAWWGVPVDLPEARFASLLEVTVPLEEKPRGPKYLCDEFTDQNERAICLNQLIYEARDMSLYDDGGIHGCNRKHLELDLIECEPTVEKARRFVWEHWKKRKRGYVAIVKTYPEGEWATHLFIEPKSDGKWRIAERRVPMLREPIDPEHYCLGDLIEIKWERATSDDERWGVTPGGMYLRLSNITGDSLIL
jgi:hypothetical protein